MRKEDFENFTLTGYIKSRRKQWVTYLNFYLTCIDQQEAVKSHDHPYHRRTWYQQYIYIYIRIFHLHYRTPKSLKDVNFFLAEIRGERASEWHRWCKRNSCEGRTDEWKVCGVEVTTGSSSSFYGFPWKVNAKRNK